MRRRTVSAALFVIVAGGVWLALHVYLLKHQPDPNREILWGTTFSETFSKDLGLDWKANYQALLTELHVHHLRIPAYWNLVEPSQNTFDFADLDYQVHLAEMHEADLILTVGVKAPRWPECYYPAWTNALDDTDRRQALLDYEQAVIERYKDSPAIRYFQIENEPYLPFGNCAHNDVPGFLTEEIRAAKAIDPHHLLLLTSSILVDPWFPAAAKGDVFGISMYLDLYNDRFGYIHYPLSSAFFKIKELITRTLLHDHTKRFIVIELQGEPWVKNGLPNSTAADQLAHFDLAGFKNMIAYAKDTGYDEYYLWGSEWWYWMKTKQGHPEFSDFAKTLFQGSK
jgi:hypothetical protein